MDLKKITESKTARGFIFGLGAFVFTLVIFQAGIFVGYHKAGFAGRFGDNYYRSFGPGRAGMMGLMEERLPFDNDIVGGHGAAGQIVRVNLPTMIIAGPDGIEKIVSIGSSTLIRQNRDSLTAQDLKSGDFAVIIGVPNEQAKIEARLIRLLSSTTTSPKFSQ